MAQAQVDRAASTRGRSGHAGLLKKLYIQVLAAITLGILVGVIWPGFAAAMKPLGDGFISLIRSVVPIIIFTTVVVGIARMGDMRRVGLVGLRALVYFEIVSTIALLIGLAVGNILQPGAGLHINPASFDPASPNQKAVAGYVSSARGMTVVDFLMRMVPVNIIGDIAKGDIMPVLIMALLFGFALCRMGERAARITALLDDVSRAVFAVVDIIMYLAPLGAFGAMAFTIGRFGFHTLAGLGQLIAAVYVTSILFVLLGFGLIARLAGLRVWKILRYFREELLIAFSATSSDAMIPRAIAKLETMGCTNDVVGLVLPAGFSFNTDGTAIYMTLSVLFIAQATDIHLSFGQQLSMLFVMLFTAKGAAGYTGAGFVALAATLPAAGIIPIGGLALVVGVDRFMAEIRAVTNLFSNIFATVVVAKWTGELDVACAQAALEGNALPPGEARKKALAQEAGSD